MDQQTSSHWRHPSFPPQIARLVSMMNLRDRPSPGVAGWASTSSTTCMTRTATPSALLLHIAAAEVGYQAATFEVSDLNAEERTMGRGYQLGERLETRLEDTS